MLDEAEYEREDAAPIDMLESYFAAHGWTYEREDEEVVAKVKGSWTEYELRAIWRDDDGVLQFLAFPDIRVPDERRAALYETIGLVNEQLWIGHFDMWNHEGVVLFRNSHLLTGGAEVTPQQCEALLRSATESCDLYYQAFQFVVWAGKSAAEALESVLFETVGEA